MGFSRLPTAEQQLQEHPLRFELVFGHRLEPTLDLIESPFAKLIRDSWFAKVGFMSERSCPRVASQPIRELLDSLYRVDSGRILATLIRLLGDFDLAEEAMHEAFAAALSLWPASGVPATRDHG